MKARILLLLTVLLILAACGTPPAQDRIAEAPVALTDTAPAAVEDTATAEPSDVPTSAPTRTPRPIPTLTRTAAPSPTDTPSATDTPSPTDTPSATNTPRPTDTRQPTYTPRPSSTPSPQPTSTAIPPTPTPVPPTPVPPTATLPVVEAPAPTAEPAPVRSAPVAGLIAILSVNKQAEYVDIQNQGGADIDLTGWRLVSEKGNQECRLGFVLAVGQSIRIWARAEDAGQGGFNCGFGTTIWNNSERDPAVLYDAAGNEVARQ